MITTMALPFTANALGPWNRFMQDAKFPSQAMLDHYIWANPVLGSSTVFVNAGVASNGSASNFTSFRGQPDFPRNVTITPGGTTVSIVASGTAVVSGLNIFGKAISENFAISANQSTISTGSKAFASVSSVTFPQTLGLGATVFIGVGTKFGISRCVDFAGDYVFSMFGGVYDSTRGTMAANATAVESNTFQPNSSVDGAHNVDLFYIENFRCFGN